MTKCEETLGRMHLYLDEELEAAECSIIKAHLNKCEACRAIFQSEHRVLESIREARPLHVASPQLRTRVQALLDTEPVGPPAPPELRQRIQRLLWHRPPGPSGPLDLRYALAVSAIIALLLFVGLWRLKKSSSGVELPTTSDFALMAADTHLRHSLGQLPLEIVSDMPGQISAWFTGKVPFLMKLPNYQESSGQEKLYQLEGARLVGYKSDYAAYVAYQMHSRPISLIVTSETVAQASGGEQIVAKGLTFHYNSIKGLKVITWSDRGLTYALVSNLEERGQESCIVCHQGTKDRDFIESLKPR
jgi:anti-sigma factor RsiW